MSTSVHAGRSRQGSRAHLALAVLALVLAVTGCSSSPRQPLPPPQSGTLRLGYTAVLADAPALAGLQLGFLPPDLGTVGLDPVAYGSPQAEELALERGQLDAAYLDPVAAVAVWQADHGIRIVAGVATGGAELVTRDRITSPAQLSGTLIAAPPGGTEQAALAWWLRASKVTAKVPASDVMSGQFLVQALRDGKLGAAWEPAPVDAELVAAGGRELVNEAALWPTGQFPTSVLVVTSGFLAAHPQAVRLLLRGEIRASDFLVSDPSAADAAAGAQLRVLDGSALPEQVLSAGFSQMQYSVQPPVASVLAEAQQAASSGLLAPGLDLDGFFDLSPLDALLKGGLQ
jgi:NitT/TauT family transport system substrate-binding protein